MGSFLSSPYSSPPASDAGPPTPIIAGEQEVTSDVNIASLLADDLLKSYIFVKYLTQRVVSVSAKNLTLPDYSPSRSLLPSNLQVFCEQ